MFFCEINENLDIEHVGDGEGAEILITFGYEMFLEYTLCDEPRYVVVELYGLFGILVEFFSDGIDIWVVKFIECDVGVSAVKLEASFLVGDLDEHDCFSNSFGESAKVVHFVFGKNRPVFELIGDLLGDSRGSGFEPRENALVS